MWGGKQQFLMTLKVEIIFYLTLEDQGNASPNKFHLLKLLGTSYLI